MTSFLFFICFILLLASTISSWGILLKTNGLKTALCSSIRNHGNVMSSLQDKLQGRKIFLVGLMGSGKSTLGSRLAKQLRYQHYDTDSIIEETIQMPIATYFEQHGETKFRTLETSTLAHICQSDTPVVVSTGGGIVLKDENWALLKTGVVVFLDPSVSTIVQRLTFNPGQVNSRPLLRDAENLHTRLEQMRNDRMEKYLRSDVHVPISSTDSTRTVVTNIANQLLELLNTNKT